MAEPAPLIRVMGSIIQRAGREGFNEFLISLDIIDMPGNCMSMILRTSFGWRSGYPGWFNLRDRAVAELERRGESRELLGELLDVDISDYS